MKLLDSRRLTGLNVTWERPSAIIDVAFQDKEDSELFFNRWRTHVTAMLDAIGWSSEQTISHRFAGGVSMLLSAPIDGLYAAVELAEWAFEVTEREFLNPDVETDKDEFQIHAKLISSLIEDERNPALIDLQKNAHKHDVAFLWDDDEVSVGYGKGSQTWAADKLPANIDWSEVHDIPVALITGTNGKTTTVRLSSHILKASGFTVGLSSTDWIGVNNEIIERGDYSGPGGARAILRQKSIDVAVLETARGGLLRRGLGVQRADVALITNISEDHLGDFGSQNLQELFELKWIVMQALDENSIAVLNADDPMLVERSDELLKPQVCWFSMDVKNPKVYEQISNGGKVTTVENGNIIRYDGKHWHTLCAIASVPITLNGIAKHNVANALAAVSLCNALGVKDDAIVSGLESMTSNENPGRCNLFRVNGCEVLLDFAHNPDAMNGIFEIARHHPAKRRVLCFGQAGDRTDGLIKQLARGAWSIGLDRIIISELGAYTRGRKTGEVYALLREELLRVGARDNQISYHQKESESLDEALTWAQPGDLVIMLALGESNELIHKLSEIGESV